MADVVTEGCATAAAHRLSILWKQKWDTQMTDVFSKSLVVCGKGGFEFLPLQIILRPSSHDTETYLRWSDPNRSARDTANCQQIWRIQDVNTQNATLVQSGQWTQYLN